MDRYYTEEQEKALEGYLGFTPNAEFFFTPEAFKKALAKDKWPVFKLRAPDGRVQALIESQMGYLNKEGDYFVNAGNARFALLKHCVRGWKGFRDREGEIPFELVADEVPDHVLARIPGALQRDLEKAIRSHLSLTDEELVGLKF